MEIEFQCATKDYKRFSWRYLIENNPRRILYISLLTVIIALLATGKPFDWYNFIICFFVSGIALIAMFFLIPYLVGLRRLQKKIQANPKYTEKKKLKITNEGISSTTRDQIISWEGIMSIKYNSEFVWLILADKSLSIIPIRAFASNSEKIDFIGIVQKEIKNANGNFKLKQIDAINTKQSPPYILGIICLIPLIGALVGLLFILLGLVKYKDKWFTLIGVGGILFTVIVYTTLFGIMKNSSVVQNGFENLSQMELNNLVSKIEFYKTENGKYPDSLKQLNKNNITLIYDPIQASKNKADRAFFYQRNGDKYKLFSIGYDGKPFTKDDVLPQIPSTTVGKIGLTTYTIEKGSINIKLRK